MHLKHTAINCGRRGKSHTLLLPQKKWNVTANLGLGNTPRETEVLDIAVVDDGRINAALVRKNAPWLFWVGAPPFAAQLAARQFHANQTTRRHSRKAISE
jgi:hypothetical protein